MSPTSIEETSRVLIETLQQSKSSNILDLESIALGAKASEPNVIAILTRFVHDSQDRHFSLNPKSRVQVAMEVARLGRLKDAARALSWQEFEDFGAECLIEAGFRVEKNVRVKGDGRFWQIDLVGYRGDLVLTIDCKHWNTSGSESRLEPPAEHQRIATRHFLRTLKAASDPRNLQGLGVILTLLEPPTRFLEKVALVSVEKLPNFLIGVNPLDPSLPLISTSDPMSKNL